MRSIKTSFNLHRILEFGFRNISLRQTIAQPIPQILELANYQRGILGWASGAESSERALALKEIAPLTCSAHIPW